MRLKDRVMPLEDFSKDEQKRIAELVAQEKPPPRWIYFGFAEDSRPMAAIESRAWYEWYWQRGRKVKRDRIDPFIRLRVIERDGYVCGICGDAVEEGDVHLDHITPWSHGGEDTVDNLRVTHSKCNIKRGNRVDE